MDGRGETAAARIERGTRAPLLQETWPQGEAHGPYRRAAEPAVLTSGHARARKPVPQPEGADQGRTSLHAARDALLFIRDAAGSEMALLDEHGVIVSVNAAWREGLSALQPQRTDGALGETYLELCGGMIADNGIAALRQGLEDLATRRSTEFVQVYVLNSPDGLRWRQQRIIPFPLATPYLVAIHEDITDVEHARAALSNKSDQLLWAQENERQRIAIELHDSTSQHLVALSLGIQRLRRLALETAGVGDVLADMTTSVREAVKEIRVMSYLVKPDGLERNGLKSTIQHFVSGFTARSGLETTFSARGDVDAAAAPMQHAALRIVQEALSNAYRHAGGSRVDVELAHSGETLAVRIADNGKGIARQADGELALPSGGVGIASMRARVAQLRGELNIRSGAGGTLVEAMLPI